MVNLFPFGQSSFVPQMLKLFFLVERCFQLREPVLLVGETGGGKTILVSSNIEQAASTLDMLNGYKEGQIQIPDVSRDDLCAFEQLKFELDVLHKKWQSIFEWHDGPLVKTMRRGDLFLVDEISLTDDSVLKRLNSVLEPERTLSLCCNPFSACLALSFPSKLMPPSVQGYRGENLSFEWFRKLM
ncbi:hypothetical protein Ahy_B08g092235 [Arachis hypogaea]|uniref:ATPase dynein-related AAA domain-containing protein n=1 Tax=Arachis hypogaea TaxID=3818 RepID=A0A444Y3I5_ARAHY|nr:uncharacterized protein LOC112769881 [Arachis hypogaea]RYQ96477.1 hypothetical protein Ahy_B08g092235 [Arachis hypogaea]